MTSIKKILLAEDDEDDRMIFDEIINQLQKDADFAFEAVENGLKVLQLLQGSASHHLPDLIVLDQNMPQMNGMEALALLKADQHFSHIPVVIYSTYNDARLSAECTRLGAAQVITKPDSYEGFYSIVSMLVDKYLLENAL